MLEVHRFGHRWAELTRDIADRHNKLSTCLYKDYAEPAHYCVFHIGSSKAFYKLTIEMTLVAVKKSRALKPLNGGYGRTPNMERERKAGCLRDTRIVHGKPLRFSTKPYTYRICVGAVNRPETSQWSVTVSEIQEVTGSRHVCG
ncbi:hypothetical protein RRG08_011507 [Elysia crispata]|uniref:Uncharacterized protein n=1 Tax=Elysia crispata TaxID=231223 RepID=A0AAE1DUW1_9GAST|nr:hypothetical protein RRG08_011507 [Elysia crispata]